MGAQQCLRDSGSKQDRRQLPYGSNSTQASRVDSCITEAPDQLKACLGWGELVELRKGLMMTQLLH